MATFKTNFIFTYKFIIRFLMQISFEEPISYSKLQKCATFTNLHINKCVELLFSSTICRQKMFLSFFIVYKYCIGSLNHFLPIRIKVLSFDFVFDEYFLFFVGKEEMLKCSSGKINHYLIFLFTK